MTTMQQLNTETHDATLWRYMIGTVIRPRRTFETLLSGPQRMRHGLSGW